MPPPAEPVSLDGMHLRGSARAAVALIVFSDFQCPFCRSFARNVLPEIARRYVPGGRVMIAFSDFPLVSIHPAALRRAVIAECAGRQGRFWEVHDALFARQTEPFVETNAVQGLDASALGQCVASTGEPAVRARLAKAEALGVRSTPTIFVGKMDARGVKVTDVILGVQSTDSLSQVVDRLLRGRR
jgi:protein-disulfide isomerase